MIPVPITKLQTNKWTNDIKQATRLTGNSILAIHALSPTSTKILVKGSTSVLDKMLGSVPQHHKVTNILQLSPGLFDVTLQYRQ